MRNILGGEREKWNGASYLIKEARKRLFNGGEKGGGERENVKLTLITFDSKKE